MSYLGFTLFVLFFAVQIILPLRRYIAILLFGKGRGYMMSNVYTYFSWMSYLRLDVGYVEFTIYDRTNGETVVTLCPNQVLIKEQYETMAVHPSLQLQYAHFLRKSMKLDEYNYGIKGYCEINCNDRGWKKIVSPFTDLALEPIKIFGLYDWHE